MPTEFRFDDLDLREEPAHSMLEASDFVTQYCTVQTQNCAKTAYCTVACCTDAC